MPTKNDISNYQVSSKSTLPGQPSTQANKPWRKTKRIEEKESMTISIRLTPSDYEKVKKKAGLVNLATLVKHELRTNTDLFK